MEGTVKFDRETCCALERGFEQNPKVAKELADILGEEKIKTLVRILPNTNKMKFVPTEEMKTAYSQIATRELERIDAEDEDDEDLSCGHSVEEHRQALKSVVEIMKQTVN